MLQLSLMGLLGSQVLTQWDFHLIPAYLAFHVLYWGIRGYLENQAVLARLRPAG